MIYSEVSGTLIKILVSKNQIIEEDTDLLVIECMKMHIPITAKKRGKIIDIFINKDINHASSSNLYLARWSKTHEKTAIENPNTA